MPKIKLIKELSENQFNWRNDPRIYRYTRQNGLISKADQAAWLDKISKDPTIMMFGGLVTESIHSLDIGKNTLTCGLTSISHVHGTAEFSLLVGPEYHRRGYGKEGLKELLLYAFNHLRLNTVWGECLVGNHAIDMFRALGFQIEGLLKARYFKDGAYQDSVPVSIRKGELKC